LMNFNSNGSTLNRISNSDFPYNKSYTNSLVVGGDMLSADFGVDAFLGTNFNCNHPTFSYEAFGDASAIINFLDTSVTAFNAEVIYGVKNGVHLADGITCTIFDQVVYNQPIPHVDCSMHSHALFSENTGFDVSYTLWVSVIPVTFIASVDLSLYVDFKWKVCDTDLSALVEVTPNGVVTASGGAMSDLLVVEGGINLNAVFEMTPTPEAFILGSECTVGFDVLVDYNPMQASVDVWYRTESCYLWIFDCHWGPYNTDTLWSYSAGEHRVVLINETWKIGRS